MTRIVKTSGTVEISGNFEIFGELTQSPVTLAGLIARKGHPRLIQTSATNGQAAAAAPPLFLSVAPSLTRHAKANDDFAKPYRVLQKVQIAAPHASREDAESGGCPTAEKSITLDASLEQASLEVISSAQ